MKRNLSLHFIIEGVAADLCRQSLCAKFKILKSFTLIYHTRWNLNDVLNFMHLRIDFIEKQTIVISFKNIVNKIRIILLWCVACGDYSNRNIL